MAALAALLWWGWEVGGPAGQNTVLDDGGGGSGRQLERHADKAAWGKPGLRQPAPQPDGGVLVSFDWGAGDGSLGRSRQPEGNPEGPMSLTVAPDGTVVVLDQVNGRLVRLDASGRPLAAVPIPLQAPQDVVVAADGTLVAIDRLVDKAIAIIGPDGKPRGELPLEGKGMPEGGASTGVFVDGHDVLVEREHGDLVRVGDLSGKRDDARGDVPGRPSRDGRSYLTASIIDAAAGTVSFTAVEHATQAHRFTRQLSFGHRVLSLVLLDSDSSGVGYLGAAVELPGSTPAAVQLAISVLCVDTADGQPVGRAGFGSNTVPDESFRELAVSGDGSIYFLRRTEQGAQLERHRCQ